MMTKHTLAMIALVLLLAAPLCAVEPLRAYHLYVHYSTPSEIYPGVRAKRDVPSALVADWTIVGRIPTSVDEAMDPAFKAGVSNARVALFLEQQEGAPVARGQLAFLAKKIRAMPSELSKALYLMESGNAVIGADWEYDGETGIAQARFPYRGHTLFVRLERLPLTVLLPVEEDP